MSFRLYAIAAVLPLALAACATSATVCRTELKLERRAGLMLAPVSVNGTTVSGILDTGAEVSAVTDGLVTRLGLLGDDRYGSVVGGVGGDGTPQNDAQVSQFVFAGFDPGESHYPVIGLPSDLAAAHGSAPPIGALIGADALSHFDIDLDVAHRLAILHDAGRCHVEVPDWQGPFTQVPLHTTWSGRLLLTVKIDGQDMRAMLDSGSTASALDLPAAERLGVSAEMLSHDPGGEGAGAAGVNFRQVLHRFRSLEVGGERYGSPKLVVLDRRLQEADMLLGLDWLRGHRVWISYRRDMLFIARTSG